MHRNYTDNIHPPAQKGFWKGFGETFFLKKGFPKKKSKIIIHKGETI